LRCVFRGGRRRLQREKRRLGAVDEGAEVGLEDAGILAGGLLDGAIEGIEDPEEPGRLRRDAAGDEGLEMLPGTLPESGSIRPVVSLEDLQEPQGFPQVQFRILDREHRGRLLIAGKSGEALGDGDREEAIGDEARGIRGKRLQDGKAFLHPGLLLPKAPEDGMDGKLLLRAEIDEDVEFLPEGGAPGRVIEPEAVKLRLRPGPCFLDDPRLLISPGLQGEEPLEAIDEEKSALVLDDDEGVIAIGIGGDRLGRDEFGRDGGEGDFADAHGCAPGIAFAGGRERTWKVGKRKATRPFLTRPAVARMTSSSGSFRSREMAL
jgi:hypothetical protein